MEGQVNIEMAPFVFGALMILVFVVLGSRTLFFAPETSVCTEPDLNSVDLPRRTGNFKFVEENPGKYVVYAEYERWEMNELFDGFKKVYWKRADQDDINAYYDMRFLEKSGRMG
ncbi:hypothetical protein [Sphingobacterium multivorum]|uniref:hypothetical protein n=1 Tax=Sphingobacterium multivorum TaxID=28454 RepID=UPI003DA441FE